MAWGEYVSPWYDFGPDENTINHEGILCSGPIGFIEYRKEIPFVDTNPNEHIDTNNLEHDSPVEEPKFVHVHGTFCCSDPILSEDDHLPT